MSSESAKPAHSISRADICKQRDRLLASRTFAQGHQLQKLLALMVRHSLLSRGGRITQEIIAHAVLQTNDFDSTSDSGVRRLVGRLRERLRDYYAEEGRNDEIIFRFPKGRPYRLVATRRRSIETAHPVDDRAFAEYEKGRSLWAARTLESLQAAMGCFWRAIALVPSYSSAHTALGECYSFMVLCGAAPRDVMPKAKMHALRALEIDDNDASAHALLASILSAYEWKWHAATCEFERALALDDRNAGTYCWQASHLVCLGRHREAVRAARLAQAAESTAVSALVNAHAAKIFLTSARYSDALSLLERIQEECPNIYLSYWYLGVLKGVVGVEHQVGIELLQKAVALSHENPSVLAALGSVLAKAGRTTEAEEILSTLLERRSQTYVSATDLASLCSALDRSKEGLEWLECALEDRCLFLTWLTSWPPLRDLARDPRASGIRRRLGLSG